MLYKNREGYTDRTAGEAIRKADKLPDHVSWFLGAVKSIAELVGLEVIGRIHIRDKKTKKEYR